MESFERSLQETTQKTFGMIKNPPRDRQKRWCNEDVNDSATEKCFGKEGNRETLIRKGI